MKESAPRIEAALVMDEVILITFSSEWLRSLIDAKKRVAVVGVATVFRLDV